MMINFTTSRFVRQEEPKKLTSPAGIDFHEEDSFLRRLELTKWIKLYFDFTYYLGASPFRLVRDIGTGYYRVKVWRFQQLLCAIMHILCIFRLISQLRASIPEEYSGWIKNHMPYLKMTIQVFMVCFKVTTIKMFWLGQHDYLKIVNFVLMENNLPVGNKRVTKPYFIYMIYGFATLKILACMICGYDFVSSIRELSPSWWFRRLVAMSRFVFCFEKKPGKPVAPEIKDITVWDGFLAVLMAISFFSRRVVGEFCLLIILAASLTLWTTASSFAENIRDMLRQELVEKQEPILARFITTTEVKVLPETEYTHKQRHKNNWQLIYKNFQANQILSQEINGALGNLVTWFMTELLMFYSINLNTFVLTKDEFKRFHDIIIYFTFGILLVSADICTKIASVKTWLSRNDNIKNVPPEEANLVLHEMIAKDIGMRGSDIYTITFPLLAGYMSRILTIFVICVQYDNN